MRLLMLTNGLPYPPQSGGALRAYGLLYCLWRAGHQVTLLSFDATHQPHQKTRTPLSERCEAVHIVAPPSRTSADRLRHLLISRQPDIVQRMHSTTMHAALERIARAGDFDAIQFEGLEMATYMPFAHTFGLRARLIYDAFNAEFALQRTIASIDAAAGSLSGLASAAYSHIQAARIHAYERSLCELADAVIAVSDEDAALLQPLRGARPIAIVPSGIFTADYKQNTALQLGSSALVFTGKMDYRPNIDAAVWFAHDILPHITVTRSDARFWIVGQKPTAAIEALAANPTVSVTGAVSEISPYLYGASVYVAPLRMGSGTRLKLLEAMACGCAIVATPIAAAGLGDAARGSMIIRSGAEEFAAAIVDLLMNVEERETLKTAAQRAVREYYDWQTLMPRLLAVYEGLGLG